MFDYTARWKRAQAILPELELDALIVSPSQDLDYFTGLKPRYMGWTSFFLITPQQVYFVVSGIEREMYLKTPVGHAECLGWNRGESRLAKVIDLLKSCKTVAVGSQFLSCHLLELQAALPHVTWKNADLVMSRLRVVKDAQEIQILREAQQSAEAALYQVFEEGIEGLTERQVAEKIMRYRMERGFDSVGAGIVASGPGSAEPHHFTSDRVIQDGDVVMVDIGGIYKGYSADITRTVVVNRIPDGFQEIYELCLAAHMAAVQGARPNMTCGELDKLSRNVIQEGGFGQFYNHALGHGTGLSLHELPSIDRNVPAPIAPGTVFTIEPGIYLEGKYGVRIEDLLVMTEAGAETFNLSSKELTIIH